MPPSHENIASNILTPHRSTFQPTNNTQPSSWSNPKKRPAGASSTDLRDSTQDDLVLAEVNNGNISHPYKRSRGPDWPLKSTEKNSPHRVMNLKQKKKSTSPGQKQNASAKPRNSKFVEGSMNDRVSTKPPSLYTREEQMMEQYQDQDETNGRTPVNKDSLDNNRFYYDDGIDNFRPSGMYRFGRALVSAFNPVNVWQGINGFWRDREGKVEPQKNVLEERRIKAEKTYAELKKSGYKGTGKSASHSMSIDNLISKHEKTKEQPLGFSIRDSGVDMDEDYSLSETKPKEYTEENVLEYLAPPPFTLQGSGGPADNPSSRKSSRHLRKPSFTSLKKVKSQIQLSATKRQPILSPSIASATPEVNHEQAINHELKKQPSKKDVAKQQKLSKKVSDLEAKLDVARRELKLSLQGVPDVPKIPKSDRKPFKPGHLASLPSESIIDAKKILDEENDIEMKAVSDPKNLTTSLASDQTPDKRATADTTMLEPQSFSAEQQMSQKNSAKKRKSNAKTIDSTYRPLLGGTTDSESDHESLRRSKRPRKPRKLDDFVAPKIKDSKSKEGLRSLPKFPKGLKLEDKVPIPPVPPINFVFDPAKIDKEKLMAMRSVPNKSTPFGYVSEDLFILRKEFPATPDNELTEYVSKLAQSKLATEYTSTAHGDQPTSPVLSRPRSRSPTKFTPHNTAPDSGTTSFGDVVNSSSSGILLEKIDENVSNNMHIDMTISESQPQPKDENKKVKRSYSKKDLEDKPLPPVQKEYYEWGPDVF
ncbi:MAG: hypothetical protein Q9167_000481 [Letrouitia subvulpina]